MYTDSSLPSKVLELSVPGILREKVFYVQVNSFYIGAVGFSVVSKQ